MFIFGLWWINPNRVREVNWIALGPTKAVIPYAKRIARLTNADAPRMKRDYKALLNLIKAYAILHQENRDRDGKNRIIANEDDYKAAYELVSLFIAEGVEQSVPGPIRETVQTVLELLKNKEENSGELPGMGLDNYSISLNELCAKLDLHKSTVSRRVDAAEELGYLIKTDKRPGCPLHIKLGEPLPEEQEVLPSPEKIFDDSEE